MLLTIAFLLAVQIGMLFRLIRRENKDFQISIYCDERPAVFLHWLYIFICAKIIILDMAAIYYLFNLVE